MPAVPHQANHTARAFASEVPRHGEAIPTTIVLLPETCYRCHHWTRPVVGLTFNRSALRDGAAYLMEETDDGDWFLRYDESSADVIATVCPDELLRAHGTGPLRWRTTRYAPDGYLANTCHHCGTVLGNFPLVEALIEYETEGGELDDLPSLKATIHVAALEWLS